MGLIMLTDDIGVFMNTSEGIKKLEGFSEFGLDSGAQSYIRKYFSEKQKSVDITESLPEISYAFDRMTENRVHNELSCIADQGLIGKDAVKEFVFVDFSKGVGRHPALMQSFVVKSSERFGKDGFLTYSGKLIAKDKLKNGHFILNDDLKSGEFIAERGGILCD